MITRIHSASVAVTDQDAAVDFYTNKLGWEKRTDTPMGDMRYITVAPKGSGAELALLHQRMMSDDNESKPGMNSGINLVCRDVQRTSDELMAKGVNFPMPPTQMPWGPMGAHLTDPDGNIFFLTEDNKSQPSVGF